MLFRNKIEPLCIYCKYASRISVDRVACLKHGVIPQYSACRSFSYDPLKRIPERPKKLRNISLDLDDDLFTL